MHDANDFCGGVVDDTLCDGDKVRDAAVGCMLDDEADGLVFDKVALDLQDRVRIEGSATGALARGAVRDRFGDVRLNDDGAGSVQAMEDPPFAVNQGLRLGHKARVEHFTCLVFAFNDGQNVLGFGAARDDGRDARGRGQVGRDQLGHHAAGAERRARRRHGDLFAEPFDVVAHQDGARVRVRARVVGVQTVDVGHQEQVVGLDHAGRDGRERIVVTKFDFLWGGCVCVCDISE